MKILFSTIALAFCLLACRKESSSPPRDEAACLIPQALTGDSSKPHDFVFPEGLAEYTSGTSVYQPKTGRTYACKGFPYTVYCRQWSSISTRFEPGTGSNWMAAWDLK